MSPRKAPRRPVAKTASTRSLRSRFLAFDDELAKRGVPPLTPWWRDGIGAWLDRWEAGEVPELYACAGRGSSKSTALYKLATFFTLYVSWAIPPGERHFAIILSRLVGEAGKGIGIIDAWLRLLGVAHHVVGDVIELDELPRGIRVVAASVAAASGWRAFFVGKDERSKWPMSGVDELDASEIDTSAAAMTATHAHAPNVAFGSAWGAFGEFFDAIMGGTTADRVILGPAPTWVAAPHITEASTRRKERDPRRWAREYAAEFQKGALGAFELEDIDRAFAPRKTGIAVGSRHMVIDASSGRVDTFTYGVCGFERQADGPPVLVWYALEGITPAQARELGSAGVVARIAGAAKSYRCAERVHGDQRDAFSLSAEFDRHRLRLAVHDWTASSKAPAVETVRRWLRDGLLALPRHEVLRREMLQFEEKITPDGQFTFAARGSGHDDFVALLVTAAMATIDGHMRPEKPTTRRGGSVFVSASPLAGLLAMGGPNGFSV